MELSEQNECISISQYDDFRQKKNGRCFFFKNGVLARECLIESDNMIQVKREFVGKQMKEFDECNRVSYVGEYVGSMKEGYHRTGMGIEYKKERLSIVDGWKMEFILLQLRNHTIILDIVKSETVKMIWFRLLSMIEPM